MKQTNIRSFILGILLILFSTALITACTSPTTKQVVAPALITPTTADLFASTATPEPTAQLEPTAEQTATSQPTAEVQPSPTGQPAATEEAAIPSPTTASPTAEPNPPDCTNLFAFLGDLTVPDGTMFSQGEKFTKTWRFQNAGTCTWNTSYKIVNHSGDIMSAPISQAFSGETPPGAIMDIGLDMVAPSRGGMHHGNWWFEAPDGQRFGSGFNQGYIFWVEINSRYFDAQGTPQADPVSLPVPPAPSGCAARADTSVANQVLSLINQQRAQAGLPPLNANSALASAAQRHSVDMACNSFVDHAGTDGTTWYDRISAAGYSYSNANENIYVGFPDFGGTAKGAVTWWMNSQVHRDNILNSQNVDAGVGYVFDANSQWGGYYTIVFARP